MTTGAPRQLGPFETDSRASKPDWPRGFSIKTGTRPLSHVAAWVGGGKKAFEVERAVLRNYAMWCSKVALSLVHTERSTPISEGYPL